MSRRHLLSLPCRWRLPLAAKLRPAVAATTQLTRVSQMTKAGPRDSLRSATLALEPELDVSDLERTGRPAREVRDG